MDIAKEINGFVLSCSRSRAGSCFESYSKLAEILHELNREQDELRLGVNGNYDAINAHHTNDDRHITTAKEEELNRCPRCGNREITPYSCLTNGVTSYGCNQCFLRTKYYNLPGEAFEAWQAGDNG